MAINNKTLAAVEALSTNSGTTEGNFRTGLGDVLIQVDANQVAIDNLNPFPAFENNTWTTMPSTGVTAPAAGDGLFLLATHSMTPGGNEQSSSTTISITGTGSWSSVVGGGNNIASITRVLRTGSNTGNISTGQGQTLNLMIQGYLAPGGTISASGNGLSGFSGVYRAL